MRSPLPGISQLISYCIRQRSSCVLALAVMLLGSHPALFAQFTQVGTLAFPATNVASSSAPQNLILKTTAAETITSFTVPVSDGNKQEYRLGSVSGCVVDGVTSNPVGTICTIPITFSPGYPGQRPVPLQAVTSAGKINIGLNGMGVSPLAVFTPGTMSTIAGAASSPNCNAYSGPALLGPICNPSAGAVDFAGNVYVAAFYSNTVSRIDTSGNITVIAGTGGYGISGIGGPATSANIERPSDVIVDAAGNVYFGDETAQQIFRIDAITQIMTSVAGNGTQGYSGDNGPATQASLNRPEGIALDLQGNLYIEDQDNNLIRKVSPAGIITTVAGTTASIGQSLPAYGGDGGPATQANLALCCQGVYASYDSIAVDAAGNLFIGDSGHHVVREVTTDGIIHTVAGNNALGAGFSGDGGAATSAQLNWPMGVAVDPAGDLYIADFSNNRIRKVNAATQTITTVVGNGSQGFADGGSATQGSLNGPQKIVLDGKGNLYVADTKNNLVRKADVSTPALTFATPTTVGSVDTTDGPMQAIVSNIGNAPLTLPPPTTGSNASVSAGFSFFIGNSGPCPFEGPLSTSPGTLAQGSSCGLSVEFTPGNTTGPITGSIVLTDNSLNAASPYATQTVSLAGTAVARVNTGSLSIAPTTQAFASTAVGSTSSTLTSTITNTTSNAIYISAGSLTDAVDFTQTVTCSGIIAANGGTCTVAFTFTPQSTGPLTSTFSIHDLNNPGSPLTVVLSGNAAAPPAPQPVLTPSTINFGSLTVATTSTAQTATLQNTGNAPLTISSFGFFGTNTSSFSQTNTCGASLAAGASCSIALTCTPAATGSLSANLGANFPSPVAQQSIALSCTGTPAPAPQAALGPAAATFGSVTSGTTSSAQIVTLQNAGNASLSITSVSITSGSGFAISTNGCGTSLAAGASCPIAVTFTPQATGNATATLTVIDAVGTQTSTLSGTGTAAPAPLAALTPATASFGSLTVGTSSTAQTFQLSNAGNASLPITSVSVTSSSGFAIGTNGCGATLAAGASCQIAVTFTPQTTGNASATLTVIDSVGTQTSTLSGTGTAVPAPQAVLTPATASFGSLTVGTSSTAQTFQLSNAGNASLPITSVSVTSSSGFAIGTNGCGATLAAGASCQIAVTFTPQTTGNASATLTVIDSVGTQTSTLSGTGTAVPAPQAVLTPATASFGSLTVGTKSSSQSFQLANAGNAALPITSIAVTSGSGFAISTNGCGTSLAAGTSCQIALTFTPQTTGNASATLTVIDSVGTQTSTLSGTGTAVPTPQAALTPVTASFGSLTVGSTSTAQSFQLSNAGNASLPITSVSITSGSGFAITANGCGTSLAAGASCQIAVTFTPQATGNASATLTIVDSVGTQTSMLSGSGIVTVATDFTLATTPSAQSGYLGSSVTYGIQLASASVANAFTGTVTLAVTGLPSGATASFSPAAVTPGASGATSTLTVNTPSLLSQRQSPTQPGLPGRTTAIAVAGLLGVLTFGARRRRLPALLSLCLIAVLTLVVGSATGCGSGTGFAVPASTSTLVITGTSGSITHSTNVTLTIK